ncbi:reverse transcriptase domain-containing protein [Tanacetum coccineum]
MEDDFKPAVQHQRRVNPKIHEVIKKEVIKLLDAELIYPISDIPWVRLVHCMPKKGGMTVVTNEDNELIPTRLVIRWRICIDYRKLNDATRKDHFSLPFMDQMLERLTKRCDTNLVLNWEKCHFMVKEGIVLGHKISKNGIEVDRAKVDVIAKLPHPTSVKGVQSFLGHARFYLRFIQDFSKIARPMTYLLEKDTPFIFSNECIKAFETLKKKLTEAPILVAPDWDLPFEIMCDASDYMVGTVLGQHKTKHFQPIHYVSKTMTDAQAHYTTTKKELLAVVYAFEKFRPYLVLSKTIVYTDHSTLKYLLAKQDAKPRLLQWILLLQEFDVIIRDKKERRIYDHLLRLENPHQGNLEKKEINETFPLETLGMIYFHVACRDLEAAFEYPAGRMVTLRVSMAGAKGVTTGTLVRYETSCSRLPVICVIDWICIIMPPRRFKKKSVRKIVEKRVAKAIEEYEKTRSESNNAGGSGSANTEGTVAPEMHGCSYKTFTNGKPHSFSGTEGVVGLKRWFEKIEQVFEICNVRWS